MNQKTEMETQGNWYIFKKCSDGNWRLNSHRGYTVDMAVLIARELWLSTGIEFCVNTKN